MELITIKEAAKRLGKHETSLYGMKNRGQLKFIYRNIDGRKRAFVDATKLDVPQNGKLLPAETVGITSDPGADPFDTAIDTFIQAAKDLRRAVKEHDKRVRREAVTDLVDSLREGLK